MENQKLKLIEEMLIEKIERDAVFIYKLEQFNKKLEQTNKLLEEMVGDK